MRFGFSAEMTPDANAGFIPVTQTANRHLTKAFAKGPLADVDIKIIYVPVLMNKYSIGTYPARSRRSIKDRCVHCAPQLDHARWVAGDLETKLDVWMSGLADAVIFLQRFGLTQSELDAYESCISFRPTRIVKDVTP